MSETRRFDSCCSLRQERRGMKRRGLSYQRSEAVYCWYLYIRQIDCLFDANQTNRLLTSCGSCGS
jgi:hypothetical protein